MYVDQELYVFYFDEEGEVEYAKVLNWEYPSLHSIDLSQFDAKPFDVGHSQLNRDQIIWATQFLISDSGYYHPLKETLMPANKTGIDGYQLSTQLWLELYKSNPPSTRRS